MAKKQNPKYPNLNEKLDKFEQALDRISREQKLFLYPRNEVSIIKCDYLNGKYDDEEMVNALDDLAYEILDKVGPSVVN